MTGSPLPRTVLGRTGLQVTRLGIGGSYCGTVEGYRAALGCGVSYIDTARAYGKGEDEQLIGHAIAGRRHELVLATKTLRRDATGARADLERSLQQLGTDYVDIWQVHHVNTRAARKRALAPGGVLEAAQRAREQGLVRFIGVTGHDWPEVGRAVATGLFDTVLCWYNCAMPEPEEAVFPIANALGLGVVIMQATRMDKLLADPQVPALEGFYRYVLGHPAVHTVLMGLRDVDRFRRVAEALAERETAQPEERARLEEYGMRLRAAGSLELE